MPSPLDWLLDFLWLCFKWIMIIGLLVFAVVVILMWLGF